MYYKSAAEQDGAIGYPDIWDFVFFVRKLLWAAELEEDEDHNNTNSPSCTERNSLQQNVHP